MTLNDITDPLTVCVAGFKHRRVLVLGDAMLDEYLLGDCSRISPEAPVPVLKVNSSRRVLGGAANTAANVVSLGGHATLIALVGNDEGGVIAQTVRGRRWHRSSRRSITGCATLRKTRVVGQQQQIVRLDYEEIHAPGPATEAEVLALFDACDRHLRHRRHLGLREGFPVGVAVPGDHSASARPRPARHRRSSSAASRLLSRAATT